MLVAPGESDLLGSVKLGERRLFGDQEPASDRRRHAAGTGLHRTDFLLRVHWLTLTLMPLRPNRDLAPGMSVAVRAP
jgi:hypothetical protein